MAIRLEPLGASITYGYQSSTGNGYRGPLYDELTGEGHQLDFVGSVRAARWPTPTTRATPATASTRWPP
ncbi:hypothetical protein ACFQ9X_37820 [Catenulispora yoronensis]